MKVIHILHSLKFSGAEIMYVDAASLFQAKGCELTVMATGMQLGEYSPFFEQAGYIVIHCPIPPIRNYFSRIRFYLTFIKLLKKEKYDIVHIHSHPTMWGLSFCAWLTNTKSVYTFHSVFPTRFFTFPYHCLLRWSAKYIFKCRFQTISDSVYNHELNFYHNKTKKIYNWYGSSRYYPATPDEKAKKREELGIPKDSFVLISVGGCSPIKRHSEIIKSLPIIHQKLPNFIYLHLGHGVSELEEIKLAKELKIANNIIFCGNQTDVRKYLIVSDVYIMTSLGEGISLTTIEAMACGIPTILYDVPGLRDFNNTGENSILIPEDHRILAEKVLFLQDNSKKNDEIVTRAKDFVNKNFNMETNVSEIFKFYN